MLKHLFLWTITVVAPITNGFADVHTLVPVVQVPQQQDLVDFSKGERIDGIPSRLITPNEIETPQRAFAPPYVGAFFQNDDVVVCLDDCNVEQELVPTLKDDRWTFENLRDPRAIQLATVYYWSTRYLEYLRSLGFRPQRQLLVRVLRKTIDPSSLGPFYDNAFFNSEDFSLNFLPGAELRSPAYDPSVILHELGHAFFHFLSRTTLFPATEYSDRAAINEGIADFLAMNFLNIPWIGSIFANGTPLRSTSNPEKYGPGADGHANGGAIASALWKVRQSHPGNDIAQLAVALVREYAAHPTYSIDDFDTALESAASHASSGLSPDEVSALKEGVQPFLPTGEDRRPMMTPERIAELRGLQNLRQLRSDRTLKITTTALVPSVVASAYGLKQVYSSTLNVHGYRGVQNSRRSRDAQWLLIDFPGKASMAWLGIHHDKAGLAAITAEDGADFAIPATADEIKAVNDQLEGVSSVLNLLSAGASPKPWRDLDPDSRRGAPWAISALAKTLLRGEPMMPKILHDALTEPMEIKAPDASLCFRGLRIGDSAHQICQYRVNLSRTAELDVAPLFGPGAAPYVKLFKEIRVFVTRDSALEQAPLPLLDTGEVVVGYEIPLTSGYTATVMVSGFER